MRVYEVGDVFVCLYGLVDCGCMVDGGKSPSVAASVVLSRRSILKMIAK